jgi:hypothetical protein
MLFKAIFSLVCFVSLADASDWVGIGMNSDHENVSIDRSTIEVHGDAATVWVKQSKKNGESKDHLEVLRTRKLRILYSVTTWADGHTTPPLFLGGPSPWVDIPPDSEGEFIYNALFGESAADVSMGGLRHQWFLLSTDSDGTRTYVDTANITSRAPGYKSIWWKILLKNNGGFVFHNELDRAHYRSRWLAGIIYDETGKIIFSSDSTASPGEWGSDFNSPLMQKFYDLLFPASASPGLESR